MRDIDGGVPGFHSACANCFEKAPDTVTFGCALSAPEHVASALRENICDAKTDSTADTGDQCIAVRQINCQ